MTPEVKVAVEMKNDSCVARLARQSCEAADADASVNGGEGRQPPPGWEGVPPAEVAFWMEYKKGRRC